MATSDEITEAEMGMFLAIGLGWRPRKPGSNLPNITMVRRPIDSLEVAVDDDFAEFSREANRVKRRGSSRVLLTRKLESRKYSVLKTPEQVYLAMVDIAHGYSKPSDYKIAERLDVNNFLYSVADAGTGHEQKLQLCYLWAENNLPNKFATNVFRHPEKSETPSKARVPASKIADLSSVVRNEPQVRYIRTQPTQPVVMAIRYP